MTNVKAQNETNSNVKNQSLNRKSSNDKTQSSKIWHLDFGLWIFLGVWILEFGL
jgi:hypothetical protein